ncbi:exported hypothetical protein [Curtobacterium sp. 8I-2]|nr:exported hypothetical protein [Curtobacterium sp. 8I-2]
MGVSAQVCRVMVPLISPPPLSAAFPPLEQPVRTSAVAAAVASSAVARPLVMRVVVLMASDSLVITEPVQQQSPNPCVAATVDD